MNPQNEDSRIDEEAIEWIDRLRSRPDVRTAEEFGTWVSTSPLHLSTIMKQLALGDMIEDAKKRHRMGAAEKAALASAVDRGTFGLRIPAARRLRAFADRSRWFDLRLWSLQGLAASLGVLVLLAGLAWLASGFSNWSTRDTQETAGDVYLLSDGSSVHFNKGSQIRVREFLGRRDVELVSGGAQFTVQPAKWRRFRVHAGDTEITAMGTAFNVLRHPHHTGIYVAEGVVRAEGSREGVYLRRGQSADATDDGRIENVRSLQPQFTRPLDSATFLPLRAIAEEFNRRSRVPQIEVVGSAAILPYQSTPSLDDPDSWVRALATDPTFIVEYRGDWAVVRKRTE